MVFTITSAKLTGTPGASGWVQIYEFKPEDSDKLKLRGHLFAVVATKKYEEGLDILTAGREILARLHEEYFGRQEGTSFNVLKSAVEKVIAEFKTSWGDVEIAAVASLGEVVYSVVAGGAQTAIFRNGMFAKILESTNENVVSASGYPKDKDLFLLGTKAFFESLPEGNLKAALEVNEPEGIAEFLAPTIHSQKEAGNLGSVILKFNSEQGLFEKVQPSTSSEKFEENKTVGGFMAKCLFFTKSITGKIFSFVSERLPERKVYLKKGAIPEEMPEKKKTTVSVGVALLVLLMVSIIFGIKQRRTREYKRRYESRLIQAQHDLNEAVSLVILDAERARELFKSAENTISLLKEEGIKDPTIEELSVKIEDNQGAVLGEYNVSPQLFLDLSLLSSGFIGDDLASSGEKIFVLDKNGKRIVAVIFETKKTQMVAGPDEIENPKFLAAYEDKVYVVSESGISEVGEQKVEVIKKDWTGEILAYAYAGNFYVLEKEGRMIWRFPGAGEAFGSKQKWLGAGVSPDFADVNSMTIDGSIWVLANDGTILKYTQGSPKSVGTLKIEP